MPVVNGVITAPANTWTVSKFLGMGSVGDVGTIIRKALVGGGLAFDELGYLMAGKRPYWNVFSNISPGFWAIVDRKIDFRLCGYPFALHGQWADNYDQFFGYNHNLNIGPTIGGTSSYVENSNKTVISAWVDMGNFDWRLLENNGSTASLPLYIGVRLLGQKSHEYFNPQPYVYPDNTTHGESLDIYGQYATVQIEPIIKDFTGQTYTFAENTSGVVTSSITVTTKYEEKVNVNISNLLTEDGSFRGCILNLYNGYPIPTPITIKGSIFAADGDIATALVQIYGTEWELTIPANETLSESYEAFGFSNDDAIGGKTITITTIILESTISRDKIKIFPDYYNPPRI